MTTTKLRNLTFFEHRTFINVFKNNETLCEISLPEFIFTFPIVSIYKKVKMDWNDLETIHEYIKEMEMQSFLEKLKC